MKRDIEKELIKWKEDKRRRPLMIRGARQVGKSYIITKFGKELFENIVTVNFEQNPLYKKIFNNYVPREIIKNISIISKQNIQPGKTLLFFDEIQECPEAILSLRYFYEQMPELHIIGAGSLVEFILESEKIRIPVGRLQYLFMKPMSFGEFLNAAGEEKSRELIQNSYPEKPISLILHEHFLGLLKKYFILGGMPAVIDEFINTANIEKCSQIQTAIIQTYRDDFGKV